MTVAISSAIDGEQNWSVDRISSELALFIPNSICVSVTHQVIQSSHQGFKLLLPNAALVQGAKGGASPAYGANRVGFMDGAVQQN